MGHDLKELETDLKHLSIAFAIAVLAAVPAVAQDAPKKIAIEYGISTLGAYIGPSYMLRDKISVRLPIYLGTLSGDFDQDGNSIKGKFSANSFALMGDYYLYGGGLRVSAGAAVGGYEISGNVTDPNLDGTTYVGSADVKLAQSSNVVPVVSIGYAKQFKNGFSVLADVGAKINTYKMTVATSGLTITNQAEFEADLASVNNDLKAVGLTPFITLGGVFRF